MTPGSLETCSWARITVPLVRFTGYGRPPSGPGTSQERQRFLLPKACSRLLSEVDNWPHAISSKAVARVCEGISSARRRLSARAPWSPSPLEDERRSLLCSPAVVRVRIGTLPSCRGCKRCPRVHPGHYTRFADHIAWSRVVWRYWWPPPADSYQKPGFCSAIPRCTVVTVLDRLTRRGLGAFEQLPLAMPLFPPCMGRPTRAHHTARLASGALCFCQALLGPP